MEPKEIFKTLATNVVIWAVCFVGGFGTARLHRPHKTTGPVQIQISDGHRVWFVRPNHEVFSTYFDNEFPFAIGISLKDITYTDARYEHAKFVKAQLP